ncbi:hypothetical protein [Bosea thiooxidans]
MESLSHGRCHVGAIVALGVAGWCTLPLHGVDAARAGQASSFHSLRALQVKNGIEPRGRRLGYSAVFRPHR